MRTVVKAELMTLYLVECKFACPASCGGGHFVNKNTKIKFAAQPTICARRITND